LEVKVKVLNFISSALGSAKVKVEVLNFSFLLGRLVIEGKGEAVGMRTMACLEK
jgi:hypothetical protein